jgi:4-amino-4-deoxy-L-arabinose transferase-like glycosyltransferase
MSMVTGRSRDFLLLASALLAAAVILLYRLTDFPLHFFCDEAVQGAEARSLLDTGRDRAGALWPLFIRGRGGYHLSPSVYWLIPFQALLGDSEFVVRLSHAMASLLGVAGAKPT